jgi:dihydrofolate reductase
MRKVKLQVQVSVDGFVGGPNGEMDYLTWNWDDQLKNYVTAFTDASDTIIMGSVLYQGMAGHWTAVPPDNEQYAFAQKMNQYAKIVFSGSLKEPLSWSNSRLATQSAAEEIKALKQQPGKDILVYGGARFVAGLIKENLIDEYHLFVNPVAIGKGLSIWGELGGYLKLQPVAVTPFSCGITVLTFSPLSI